MGLLQQFKKKAAGVVAQANVFDNGKTYSTVVNNAPVSTPPPAPQAPAAVSPPKNTLSNNFLTRGVSRSVDQVNPFDSGRTWKQTAPTNTRSLVGQATHNGLTNLAGNTIVKPLIRTSMAYNQAAGNVGTMLAGGKSQNAKDFFQSGGLDSVRRLTGYTGTKRQVAGDLITNAANFAAPGSSKLVEGAIAGVAPRVVPKLAVKAASNAVVGAPVGAVSNEGAYLASEDPLTKQGFINTAKQGAIFGAAGGAAIPIAGAGARAAAPVAREVAQATAAGAQKAVQAAKAAEERAFTPRASLADQYTLRDYSDHLSGAKPLGGKVLSDTITAAREIGQKHGIDLTNGSIEDRLNRSNSVLDQIGARNREVASGGYVRIPGGARDPAPDLNLEQKSFVNDYANTLKSFDDTATGGQMVPDGEGGFTRVSEHSPFYRDYYAQNGRAPTQEAYFQEARHQIESGKAMSGASDEYNRINPTLNEQQSPKVRVNDSDQLLKITANDPQGGWAAEVAQMALERRGMNMLPEEPAPRPAVNHIIEDASANTDALGKMDMARMVQEDLGRAGATLSDVVDAHAARAGIDPKQALDEVWNIADQSGYDVRSGVPLRQAADTTPLSVMKSGADTEKADLEAVAKATDELKVNATKGLVGVKHAVKIKESPYQQVWMYTDKDGKLATYITTRHGDGKWQEILNSRAPIKSASDTPEALRLTSDADIQKEVQAASQDGLTRQYIWAENPDTGTTGLKTDGRSDPVTPKTMGFDPKKHVVEGGFVRDKETGEILGNYVAVGPSGIQVQVGRQFVSLDIDPSKLSDGIGGLKNLGKSKGGNNQFNQAERWIDAVTNDPKTREQLRNIVIYPTRRAEADMKVEANALGKGIKSWRDEFSKVLPLGQRKQAMQDAVYAVEPDEKIVKEFGRDGARREAMKAFVDAHGEEAGAVLMDYEQWMRAAYDNLLERMNAVRRHNGLDEIPYREDYITHTKELSGTIAQTYQSMREGIFGEVDGNQVRGKLPAQIAGRTEEFKPIQKYNPFAKKRVADDKPTNIFDPLATYAGIALHNIHLTTPAAQVRSLETALRAAKEFATNRPEGLSAKAAETWDKLSKRYGGDYSDAVEWLTEHANILSGKSSGWNRQALKSEGGRKVIRTLNFMQRQTGRANILGNVSSTVAQSLNFPNTLGTNGVEATVKGITRAMGGIRDNAAWRKSNFMRERYTDGSLLRNKSALDKALKPFGVPMALVEKAFVHIAWNSSYEKVLAKGLTGDAAIRATDTATSKIVSGRSIGDTPHIYNDFRAVPLQFTREVTESWKNFTKDMSPYGKALALAAAFGANYAFENLTGRSPLPDPIGAVVQTIQDASGANDGNRDPESNTVGAKIGRAAQRTAETVASAVPLASSVANQLPKDIRQSLFGTNSDLGRYDGSLALLGPTINAGRSVKDFIKGNAQKAGQEAASILPGGAQIRKTWQGTDAMAKREMQDSSGNFQTAIDHSDPITWAKAVLFGKNAIPEVKQYNQTGQAAYAPGDISASINSYSRDSKKTAELFKRQFSREDNIIRSLNNEEKQRLVQSGQLSQEKIDGLTRYELGVRQKLGMPSGNGGQSSPTKLGSSLPADIKDFYRDRSYVYDGDVPTWRSSQANGPAKALIDRANQIRPQNAPALPNTNEVAELYADFSNRRANEKWGPAKENTEKVKLLNAAYKTTLEPHEREWFSLSDSAMNGAIESGEIQKPDLDKLMAFDDRLRSLGLRGEIGNALRRNYGYRAWGSSGTGRSGGGSRKRATPSLPTSYFGTGNTVASLRKLLESTT